MPARSCVTRMSLPSMLNDFVTRTPSPESKKDQRDLQVSVEGCCLPRVLCVF